MGFPWHSSIANTRKDWVVESATDTLRFNPFSGILRFRSQGGGELEGRGVSRSRGIGRRRGLKEGENLKEEYDEEEYDEAEEEEKEKEKEEGGNSGK